MSDDLVGSETIATDMAEPAPFRPRHTLAQRLVAALSILVVLACFAGAFGLLYGKNVLDNTQATPQVSIITTASLPGSIVVGSDDGSAVGETTPTTFAEFPEPDPDAVNFLIAGSDSNPCVDPNSPWAGAADPRRDTIGSRSDSIMVMRLDPEAKQAALLSFPRDLWVKVGGSNKRVNSAYVENDYSVLAQTLFDNFGITVDHYLQIDFCAFKTLVDAVGGVTVPFKTRIVDLNVGIDVPAGCHTFSGDEALAYVRSRHLRWVDKDGVTHEDPTADFGRISRQQDFLRRVLQAALNKGLYDLDVASAMVTTLQQYLVHDSGLGSLDDILGFAGVMHDIDPSDIRTYQVESTPLNVGGRSVQKPALKGENMKAILAIFQGTAPLAGAPTQTFETTTTTTIKRATTTVAASGEAGNPTTSKPSTTTSTTVASEPEENVLGDIVPDESIQC